LLYIHYCFPTSSCWRILILSCSPHTYFRSCIRRNTFTLLLTQWLLRQRSTSVSFLRLNITTLHTRCDTIKHLSLDDETRTTVNSRTPAIRAAINTIRGIQHNCTLGQTALTSDMSSQSETERRPSDGKWEKNPACAGSMPGRKVLCR